MPITVSEWRARNEPVEVELPSGAIVLLRKVDVLDLAFDGMLPMTLVVEAQKFENEGGIDAEKLLENAEDLKKWLQVINPVVVASFVDPRVALEPTDDALGINEIGARDRLAVFRWCNAEAEEVRPFRPESNPSVEPVQNGEDVRNPSE